MTQKNNKAKRIIVAMSTSCLDYHPEPHGIRILRLNVKMGNETFIDGSTLTCDDFQHWLLTHPNELASTSPPSSLVLRKFFVGLMDEGYEEVLFIGMSSALSRTYEHVCNLIPLLESKLTIHAFDSKTGTFTEGLLALEAEKCFNKGWSTKKTLERLEMLREHQQVFFGVDNLTYLVNNGRLSQASGLLASFLKIKPLIEVNRKGEAVVADKIMTTRRVMQHIANRMVPFYETGNYHFFTLYSGTSSTNLHRELQEILAEQLDLRNLPSYPISPVVAAHIGPHAFGVGIFKL